MAVVVEVGEDLAAEEVEVGVEDGDVGFRLLLVCLAIDMKSGMNFRVSETRYQNVGHLRIFGGHILIRMPQGSSIFLSGIGETRS